MAVVRIKKKPKEERKMGILIRQETRKINVVSDIISTTTDMFKKEMRWIVELRERWTIRDRERFNTLVTFLTKHKIKFFVECEDINIIVSFDNSRYETDDFEEMKDVVQALINWKAMLVTVEE